MAVTLKQIADAAGVSRGTVDRVLHGRGHVRPEVEERILRLARELHYQPNPLGRALVKSSRTTRIGVICQFSETPFMNLVTEGVELARRELGTRGTEVLLETISSYDSARLLDAMDRMVRAGVRGLALTPGHAPEIAERMREIVRGGIPVVTFNTDAPDTGRMCYVGQDNYRAGETCAGLMAMCLRDGGLVLPVSGYEDHPAHAQRQEAFRKTLEAANPSVTILPCGQCCDTDAVAQQIVREALREHPDLSGIYLSGNGQIGASRALRDAGRAGKVCVVGYDLTAENVRELKEGAIGFLIDQNAAEQGYRPARLLYEYLILNQEPEREFFYTDIVIRTRYNL